MLTFGLFASKRPVESPINNEFLPFVFSGDTERDLVGMESSREDCADRTGKAVNLA